MPKRLIKKFTPNPQKIRDSKHLKIFGSLLLDQNLWHLNRRSFAGAIAVGLFVAFIPLPGQMLISAALAIIFRVNIVIAVAMVWISNPITMPPMFYAAYSVGNLFFDIPIEAKATEFNIKTLVAELKHGWQPFLLGCFVLGSASSCLGYILARLYWRYSVIMHWFARRHKRKELK